MNIPGTVGYSVGGSGPAYGGGSTGFVGELRVVICSVGATDFVVTSSVPCTVVCCSNVVTPVS